MPPKVSHAYYLNGPWLTGGEIGADQFRVVELEVAKLPHDQVRRHLRAVDGAPPEDGEKDDGF